jgi:serine/threonine protein kinase
VTDPRAPGSKGPEQVGDYKIVTLLGEGGQGTVYLGESPGGTRVAIKLLHARFAADAETRRRFLREAEVAARVAPFCTAKVIGTGTLDQQPYIVSEYISGPSLEKLVKTGGPRTGSGLERLAVATLTALASIHRAGVIHRDFKPANVILGPEGPVVIDFGIAKALDLLTSNMDVGGTPAYASPEQLSDEPMTAASDMFSWAGTMAFAATGRLAFPATSIPAVLRAVLYDEPDITGVPDPLRAMLAACLAKDPSARPAATDLLRDLTGDDPGQPGLDLSEPRRPPVAPSDDQPAGRILTNTTAAGPIIAGGPVASGLSGTRDAIDTSDDLASGWRSPAIEQSDQGPVSEPLGPAHPKPARKRSQALLLAGSIVVVALTVTAGVLLTPSGPGDHDASGSLAAGERKTEVVIDGTKFSHVDVTDQFATDTYPKYAAYQPNGRAPLPMISAGGGKFTGTGSAPFFGLFAGPNAPSSGDSVSVLTVGAFAGSGQREDTVFVGWVKGPINYVTAWYNNTRQESGFDIRVNGAFPRRYGTTRLALVPGDRFAVRLSGNAITSYIEHDGVWRRIRTVALGDVLATPQKRQQYRYGFGLRGTTGTISITGLEGLTTRAWSAPPRRHARIGCFSTVCGNCPLSRLEVPPATRTSCEVCWFSRSCWFSHTCRFCRCCRYCGCRGCCGSKISISTSSPPTISVSHGPLTTRVRSVSPFRLLRWLRRTVSSGMPGTRGDRRLRICRNCSMSTAMSASLSEPARPSSMPSTMTSLIARVLPSSSVVTIAFQARLLCRYWSIDITASWRRKSASRKALPLQARSRDRASERADANPLLSPRPGQKWIAFAASPRRNP